MAVPQTASASLTTPTDNVTRQQCSQIKSYGGSNKQVFKPGDQVLYKQFKNKNKFDWCKGTIKKKIGKVLYIVQDASTACEVKKHTNQLVICKERNPQRQQPNYGFDDDDGNNTQISRGQEPAAAGEGSVVTGTPCSPPASIEPSASVTRCANKLLRDIPRVDYKVYF